MSEYEILLNEVRSKVLNLINAFSLTAIEYVPRLYQALLQENSNITPQQAREKIERDCSQLWKKRTIVYALPDEAKNPIKQKAGKQKNKKFVNSAAMVAAPNNRKDLLEHANGYQYYKNVNSNLKENNLTFSKCENNQIIENKEQYIRELEEIIKNQQQFQFQNHNKIFSENTLFYFPKEKVQQLKECSEKSKKYCLLRFNQNKIIIDIQDDSFTPIL